VSCSCRARSTNSGPESSSQSWWTVGPTRDRLLPWVAARGDRRWDH